MAQGQTYGVDQGVDFGMEDLKISKKALAALLEYPWTTQIREGFSLDSKLSVVGCFEFPQGDNKNLSWISQNALVRSAQKPEVLNTLAIERYDHKLQRNRK